MTTPYTPKEIDIFSDVQAASMKTGLPIVIAVFRHIANYPEFSVTKSKLIDDVKNDNGLPNAGFAIAEEILITKTIENLKDKRLLEEVGDTLKLTQSGLEAIKILKIKLSE